MAAYHCESTNELGRRVALGGCDLIDEVGAQSDDGNQNRKLARPHNRECDAHGAELWSLKPHVGLWCVEVRDKLKRRACYGCCLQGKSSLWERRRRRGRKGSIGSNDGHHT